MYKGVGVRIADFISFFLNIPVSLRPKYFIFIGINAGGGGGGSGSATEAEMILALIQQSQTTVVVGVI